MTKKKEKPAAKDHSFDVGGRKVTPKSLPERIAKKVFLCWYAENLTADETAERLGLDVAVVRWQYLMMNKTADEMDEKGEGLP
jgi:hypothetical protein